MKKVLAIDGGGIRGIIPALLLAEVEKRTNQHISDLFDLIAGTSTGGILALGLNMPDYTFQGKPQYTARALADLYLDRGSEIFPPHLYSNLWSLTGSLDHAKYPVEPFEKILEDYFGETRLSQSLKNTFITSYDIERRCPQNFSSEKARNDPSEDFLMRMLARATSAAPTYFEPFQLKKNGPEDYYALIDGGVFANNPALYAYIEAKIIYQGENDFLVVSLGTGEHAPCFPYQKARKWGLIKWSQKIFNITFDGVSSSVHSHLQHLVPSNRYFRFQANLRSVDEQIDNASPENLMELKKVSERMIDISRNQIDEACRILTA